MDAAATRTGLAGGTRRVIAGVGASIYQVSDEYQLWLEICERAHEPSLVQRFDERLRSASCAQALRWMCDVHEPLWSTGSAIRSDGYESIADSMNDAAAEYASASRDHRCSGRCPLVEQLVGLHFDELFGIYTVAHDGDLSEESAHAFAKSELAQSWLRARSPTRATTYQRSRSTWLRPKFVLFRLAKLDAKTGRGS